MVRATSVSGTLLAALGAALVAFSASAETIMHGRISYTDQSGLVKGADDSDWSYAGVNSLVMPGDTVWADDESALEIEFSGGTFLRLADGSKLDVLEAPPSALFRGTTGSFYVQRVRRSNGDVTFDTPVGAIVIAPDSQVRIDILEEGATTITVRWGEASIHSEGGAPVKLRAGERSFIDPGFLPSAATVFDRSQEDAFDSWNRSRARTIAEGSLPTPIQSSYSGGVAPMGVTDLNGYGEWVYIDNSPYWRPTVADYVPYRYGSWSYVPAQGYVWVDNYPWAYTTTHYGYWRYTPRYGWCWGYHGAYRPAYAYTVHYGDRFIWAPMDVYGYPVHYGAYSSFMIGDVRFSFGFSSYSYDYHVYGGGYHSVYLVDYHHIYDNHHHHHYNHCDYWRIDSDPSPYRNSGRPHWPGDRVNTFAPERVYRGATVARDGTTRARDRAQVLEARQPTRSNGGDTVRLARSRGNVPNAPSARREATRQVRIAEPGSTRVARVPDNVGDRASGPRTRTFGNGEARGAAPLSHGSTADRPSAPTERVRQDATPRERTGRDRSGSDAVQEPTSSRSRTITTLPPSRAPRSSGRTNDSSVQEPTDNPSRPSETRSTTRTVRSTDVTAPNSVETPTERPRPTTTRRTAEPNREPNIGRPAPSRIDTPTERPRATSSRPQVAETTRPEIIRPQSTRPSAPARQPQPIARPQGEPERVYRSAPQPQPQISRPEIQRPSNDRQQQYSRPEPQRAPQMAPAPQPRIESRSSAPQAVGHQSVPSGRSSGGDGGAGGGPSRSERSSGRSR